MKLGLKPKFTLALPLNLLVKTISLEPKNAIQELKTKGIEVELPPGERVYLGTAGGSLKSIFSTLGVDELDDYIDDNGNLVVNQLPDVPPLRKAAEIVSSARLYVRRISSQNPLGVS